VSAGRILVNTSWILGEKVLRLFAGVLVGLWVARYLGPERFGILSFGIAWVALFGTLATLGLPQVVSRDLVSFPDQAREILATAGALRMVGGILAMAVSVASFGLVYGFSDHRLVVVLCAAVATPFHTADVVEYWFRSRVEWHYVFRARVASLAVSSLLRIAFILSGRDLVWFAAVIVVEAAVGSVLLLWQWRRHGAHTCSWGFSIARARRILGDSTPTLVSSVAITVYMKIDQIMISSLISDSQLGIYSVAVRISALWYVIPAALTQSVMPSIVAARAESPVEYRRRLVRLVAVSFWLSVFAALVMIWIGPLAIRWTLGDGYTAAGSVLTVHFWAGVFVAVGVAIQQWFIAENRLLIDMHRTIAGAVLNLALNSVMIPRFGIQGAAVATVLSQFVAAYFSAWWFPSARTAWTVMNQGISLPIISAVAWVRGERGGNQ
jgi:PST family polysaccharide transporter